MIGNEHYTLLHQIPAAGNGAREISEALQRLHFEVTQAYDLNLAGFRKFIEKQFIPNLKPGDVCVVYYSGYGLQHKDHNYFVPVDFDPQAKGEVYEVAYDFENLNGDLVGLKVLLIEAGWDSPQLVQWSGSSGLASPQGSRLDTVLVLGADPNTAIAEPAGKLGLFTAALLHFLPVQGLTVSEIIQSVQKEVAEKSKGDQQIYQVGTSNVYLTPPIVIAPPQPPPPKINPGDWRVNVKDTLTYAWIPSGSFKMGCVPIDRNCDKNELPQHPVTIEPGFWITNTEVTVSAFQGFTKNNGQKKPRKKTTTNDKGKYTEHPVTRVSWQDAKDYCKWAGGRLPTEAEWEYAARAGTEDIYPWCNKFRPDLCNSIKTPEKLRKPFDETVPARHFVFRNGWKLFDVVGNVREWVLDVYDRNAYEGNGSPINPSVSAPGKERVIRGGSFWDDEKQLRLSARYHQDPSKGDNQTGFRCVVPELPQ